MLSPSELETNLAAPSYSGARTVSKQAALSAPQRKRQCRFCTRNSPRLLLWMSARSEYLRQLARKCAAAADAAADPVTKAKFEQEQQQWLLRAEQAEKAERNLMTRASREGRLRKPALPSGR
jgi:hypothetical protein